METKKKFPIQLLVTLILVITLQGCVQPEPPRLEQTLPRVFEGIAQLGVEGAPPVNVILATKLPEAPEKVPVYQVKPITEEKIYAIARKMGFEGEPNKPTSLNQPYVFTKEIEKNGMSLEITKEGSVYYHYIKRPYPEGNPATLPSFDEAKKIANDWLVSVDLYPKFVTRIIKGGGEFEQSDSNPEYIQLTTIVHFKVAMPDGSEMATSAAAVEINISGEVISVWVNLPDYEEVGSVTLKTPEVALDIITVKLTATEPDTNDITDSVISLRYFETLSVDTVTLEYALGGGYYQPVWVFRGNAQSAGNPDGEGFVGKVDAVNREK